MTKTTIQASPTKRFFVDMLTRDISLKDAILDLLDNCIDGIQRDTLGQKKEVLPYEGYYAKITLNPSEFIIEDNCGGISKQIAKESAFRLGRVDPEMDNNIPTVGVYGIGMKRAIFKMGESCTVLSRHKSEAFRVDITPAWMKNEKGPECWQLELVDTPKKDILPEPGVKISVSRLHEPIAYHFNEKNSNFISELKGEISEFFAITLKLGFEVYVNDQPIKPIELRLLNAKDGNADNSKIEPYQFKGKFGDVKVELAVGFYRRLATQDELDEEDESPHSKETAGWTIICNDRVVLYADKSMITGWGRSNVPKYHNQFIAIAGVVIFKTNNSALLPVTTTKRGLDTSSEVYLSTLDYMMEGMKLFTDFTNKWKGRPKEIKAQFANLKSSTFKEISSAENPQWVKIRKPKGGAQDAQKVVPVLPKPKGESRERLIQFRKSDQEILDVASYFFDGITTAEIKPGEIGEKCFDEILKKAR